MDIFVVEGGFDASLMQKVTRTIPIVTTMAGDLVLSGVAVSLARPGGNITGIQTVMPQLIGKHLSLLKDTIPLNLLEVTRVRGVLHHISDRALLGRELSIEEYRRSWAFTHDLLVLMPQAEGSEVWSD